MAKKRSNRKRGNQNRSKEIQHENAGFLLPVKNIAPSAPLPTEDDGTHNTNRYDYHRWYNNGTDFVRNLQCLAELSPTRSACIGDKTWLSMGDGFTINRRSRSGIFAAFQFFKEHIVGIEDKGRDLVADFLESKNNDGENLYELLEQSFRNYYGLGNVVVELVRGSVLGERYFKVYVHQIADCVLSKPKKQRGKQYVLIAKKKNVFSSNGHPPTKIRLGEWERNGKEERMAIWIKDEKIGRKIYGVPSGASSIKWQMLECLSPCHVIRRVEDGFAADTFIELVERKTLTKKQQKAIKDMFLQKFTNMEIEGLEDVQKESVITRFVQDPEMFSKVHNLQRNDDYSYIKESLLDAERNILKSEHWSPILLGVSKNNSIGRSREISDAINLATIKIIRPTQNKILSRFINTALREWGQWMGHDKSISGYSVDVSKGINPFVEMNPSGTMTINEVRAMNGMPPLSDAKGNLRPEGFELATLRQTNQNVKVS